MSGKATVLAGLLLAATFRGEAQEEAPRILMMGDVLLSRQVEVEIARTGRFPWESLSTLFNSAELVLGNLEGAVGDAAKCPAGGSPCFAIDPARTELLARAGFRALSVENNHAGDLGPEGREKTRQALLASGIRPVSFDDGPAFLRAGGHSIAIVALNLVKTPDGRYQRIPSPEVERQLRLARNLADAVVVSIHWGEELQDWPSLKQREAARWLVARGATVVMGHHPHVIQAPECVDGRPVFFSLGNHLFDQKYPETKEALIADCRIEGKSLICSALFTRRRMGSFSPELAEKASDAASPLSGCRALLHPRLTVGETTLRPGAPTDARVLVLEGIREGRTVFRTRPARTLSVEAGVLEAGSRQPFVVALERHPSPLDGEDGVRPYVYEVGSRGLIARWRGSGLAWPLVDVSLLPGDPAFLCALHRRDSYLTLDPSSPADRVAVYRWKGFGFVGVEDPSAVASCRAVWGLQ